jgi:glycosyltransferase involved in cell wall biosynthesis
LFPSFVEGFGKVFLEAMSRGLCVVAADNSGARDVISHGKDGFLVPTGDLVQMTRTCVALLKSTESMQAISRLAAARAHEFSWDRVARESAAFYEVLLKAKDRCLAGF